MSPNRESIGAITVSALLVGNFDPDRQLLDELFDTRGWTLLQAGQPRHAMLLLESRRLHVIITSADTPRWNWKKMLKAVRRVTPSPMLVVASRMADENLWAEVLNLGGYDVLAQPFDRNEVERVLTSARRHFDGMRATTSVTRTASTAA